MGNFFLRRFKSKLFKKQYAMKSETKMRRLYLSDTCTHEDRVIIVIEVSPDFNENMLQHTKQ